MKRGQAIIITLVTKGERLQYFSSKLLHYNFVHLT
jgi:hypothetical protein